MKYIIFNAKLCINNTDTWIVYYPINSFIDCKDCKGFNMLDLKRTKIERNVLSELNKSWFGKPVEIQFKSDKTMPRIKYITCIKDGDKTIKV